MHEVYSYIDFRNQKHSNFSGLKRIDKRDYPEVAIREALLNLIVHRLSEDSDKACYEKKNIMRSWTRKFFSYYRTRSYSSNNSSFLFYLEVISYH